MVELRRSLHTYDSRVARSRCLQASLWFDRTMEELRGMQAPTRDDLERAAIEFFQGMVANVDRPRHFETFNPDEELDFNIEQSTLRIAALDSQLQHNVFDTAVEVRALELTKMVTPAADPTSSELLYALQLSARVEREQHVFLLHQLRNPAKVYRSSDDVFERRGPPEHAKTAAQFQPDVQSPTVSEMADRYVSMKQNLEHVKTQLEDSSRVLNWLGQRIGADRPLNHVTKPELRLFRDDLSRLAKIKKGQATSFEDRLTNFAPEQVASVTAIRYWGFVKSFFAWASAEGYIESNPALELAIPRRKGEVRKSPEPFSVEELRALFQTPLYAGHLPNRWSTPGKSYRRDGKWWSAILLMFTGMRAGELAQLEPADFVFDAAIPYVHVRAEGQSGSKAKTVKNAAATREIPLVPILLELGLRPFVEEKAKTKCPRVFNSFRLGKGRASDGVSKFWARYLRDVELWKDGRATHVWRHTVVARLRDAGVAQEDIASVVGHEQGTMTSTYGAGYSLGRKAKTMDKLDYGFDVLAAVGGPYKKTLHG